MLSCLILCPVVMIHSLLHLSVYLSFLMSFPTPVTESFVKSLLCFDHICLTSNIICHILLHCYHHCLYYFLARTLSQSLCRVLHIIYRYYLREGADGAEQRALGTYVMLMASLLSQPSRRLAGDVCKDWVKVRYECNVILRILY